MALPVLDDATFEAEVIQANTPVVVDFMAEWCGPCKGVATTLETMAPDYEGSVKFVKVDIDKAPQTALKYAITAVPQVFLFKSGEPTERLVGAQPERNFRKMIDSNKE